MVHADDWLFPNCLTEMVELAEAHPSVGVSLLWAQRCLGSLGWLALSQHCDVREGDMPEGIARGLEVFGSPTSHLIRSDLIRSQNAFYNTNEFHMASMDQEACYDVLQGSDFGFVHQVLTYSRHHDESAPHRLHGAA